MRRALSLFVLTLGLHLAGAADAQTLRGSPRTVDLMHRQALAHGLHFYETSAGLRRAAANGTLVHLAGDANYELASVSHPYVLASTRLFVTRLAAQYRAACGEKLVVTSAARPKEMRLANGAAKSVHPTGMAVDLRKPSNPRCLSWLRGTLLHLDGAGVLNATEERNPPHFHVAVFPNPYGSYVRGGARLASAAPPPGGGTGEEAARTYRVRPGDSLWLIARRVGVTVEELQAVNSLRSSRIVAGQVLVLPASANND